MTTSKLIKEIIKKTWFYSGYEYIKYNILDAYALKSYSQEGEDMVIRELLQGKKGFYVDIGAHHPKRFSNTYYFYKNGWRGINIDPIPGTKSLFDKHRPRDINLEIGISLQPGKITYYTFREPALNTFDESLASQRVERPRLTKVSVERLENILDRYAKDVEITLMNIDVEGREEDVLRSNNWDKYRPKIIVIEMANLNLKNFDSPNHKFLEEQGYEIFAKTPRTAFYNSKE